MSRTTPLHGVHESLGATMVDFAGWRMPLRYGSESAEHRAVRGAAGLFDLSHMGEIFVTGPAAAARIGPGTTSVVFVAYAPAGVSEERLGAHLDELEANARLISGGAEVVGREVVGG